MIINLIKYLNNTSTRDTESDNSIDTNYVSSWDTESDNNIATINVGSSDLNPANNAEFSNLHARACKVRTLTIAADATQTAADGAAIGNDVSDIKFAKDPVGGVQISIDPNLALSLERVLYASLQHSWLLAASGVGLMSVSDKEKIPTRLGVFLIGVSMLSTVAALVAHFVRLFQIKSGKSFKFWQTTLFTSFITLCVLLTLSLELYFGILHPYLLRTASVAIAKEPELHSKTR